MHSTKMFLLSVLLLLLASGIGRAAAPVIQYCQPSGTANVLAPWYCGQINPQVTNVWLQWEPIVIIAIFFSFSIAAMIFMLGVVLRNKKLRDYAVAELYEAAATTIIAVIFLSLSAVLFGILPSYLAGPINPFSTSLFYINNTLTISEQLIRNIFNVIMLDSYYSSVSVQVSFEGLLQAGSSILSNLLFGIYAYFVFPATALSYLFIEGLLVLHTQFYIILFFMYIALPVFLIPGIVFRAILPLRNLGGVMIAIAIAFYMIMPMLFSVAYYFTTTGLNAQLNSYSTQIATNGQGTGAQTNAATPTSLLATSVSGLQSTMGAYWLSILFYPALITAIAYESIRIIAQFIGGATKMTGRIRAL